METAMYRPPVVTMSEWQVAREALLKREKRLTAELDAVAAQRRRLPMVRMDGSYRFGSVDGPVRLSELFEGRSQLIVYSFMWHGSDEFCSGCAMFTDNIGHLAHLHARDVTLALVSDGPLGEILPFKNRMGWSVPWYSSLGSSFNEDIGAGSGFALNVFLQEGDEVYRTYVTSGRGVERLGSNWTFLDLTPLGRQEAWEDSPAACTREAPYLWWRLHDEYDPASISHGDNGGNGSCHG
ncbi:DUF899 domain-containing protein [Nocardia rhamnosiphila]|uniref:DUF899 domain-containing protein n=1 Tax=Nocardia rhamnosiphila TaxID=426716 RepID=A0ABV2WHS5_9NOCA